MNSLEKDIQNHKHPRALPILFFAEMWERFCFYGMRALLVLYMIRGFLKYSDEEAYHLYGSYNSLVYLTPIIGGLVADKLLGFRRSIYFGGILMAIGLFVLLVQNSICFYGGLAFIIVGNGYFKPNISTLLGKLYEDDNPKRDAGFGIFYMGINIGALLSTAICGWIGENISWTYGFGVAAVGMLFGLAVFHGGKERLKGHGEIPSTTAYRKWAWPVMIGSIVAVPLISILLQYHTLVLVLLVITAIAVLGYLLYVSFTEEKVQRQRMWVLLVLVFFHTTFWAFFEQAGSSLTLFTARNVDRGIVGWEMPATWGQNFNPLFIIVLTPVFAWLWPFLSRTRINPSIPNKFALGLLQAGIGFSMLVLASNFAADGMTPLFFLIMCYLFLTTGELFLSPVGLSMVTKLAPKRMTGLVMGAWFLSVSFAHYIAGAIASLTGGASGSNASGTTDAAQSLGIYVGVFENISYVAVSVAVLLFLLSPLLKKWLHGVE
ncbi:MAG: peptide MFS transporter [Proteobacteria bacterium]|nr:peptide MFS transporter [Pseudomonadota bacterium]